MFVKVSSHSSNRIKRRARIKARVRRNLYGSPEKPRISVFRSHRYLYVQCVDDTQRNTIFGLNSRQVENLKDKNTCASAKEFGKIFGEKLKEKGIKLCVFDRSGYMYHGRVKSLADGIREADIQI